MFAVVDPDEVPGLRNILRRQVAGHDFDVITRCGAATQDDPNQTPIALIDVAFTETAVAVELALEVDEYRHSLLELVRSRQLTIMDSDRSIALQSMPMARAMRQGLSITVPIGHLEPIMGLLQQRVELPLPVYEPLSLALDEENRPDAVGAFLEDCRLPAGVGVQYRADSSPSIVIVDPDRPALPAGYDRTEPLAGRWGAMAGGDRRAARLDVFAAGQRFGSWLLPETDPRVIRAGASGSHHVMLLKEALSGDQDEAERQWVDGISVWVEHVEALRSLLVALDAREDDATAVE
jgi:hypothetical protein